MTSELLQTWRQRPPSSNNVSPCLSSNIYHSHFHITTTNTVLPPWRPYCSLKQTTNKHMQTLENGIFCIANHKTVNFNWLRPGRRILYILYIFISIVCNQSPIKSKRFAYSASLVLSDLSVDFVRDRGKYCGGHSCVCLCVCVWERETSSQCLNESMCDQCLSSASPSNVLRE